MIRIVPPIWFYTFLVLALAAHFLVPESHVFDISYPYISGTVGALLFLVGFALPLWASNIFAIEMTEILPASPTNRVLVTRGPYRYSRNPMYLGMVLMLLGAAVYLGTLPMFVAALAHFLVMNFVFVRFEEGKMARQFGEAYTAYTKSVRRWL